MLRSMTTFARKSLSREDWSAVMELRSVNSRFFDAHLRLPRELSALEDRFRKILKERLGRGRVDFFLRYESTEEVPVVFIPKTEMARNYMHAVKHLAADLDMPGSVKIQDLLLLLEDVVTSREEDVNTDKIWEKLHPLLENVLESAMEMAKREGQKASWKEQVFK